MTTITVHSEGHRIDVMDEVKTFAWRLKTRKDAGECTAGDLLLDDDREGYFCTLHEFAHDAEIGDEWEDKSEYIVRVQ